MAVETARVVLTRNGVDFGADYKAGAVVAALERLGWRPSVAQRIADAQADGASYTDAEVGAFIKGGLAELDRQIDAVEPPFQCKVCGIGAGPHLTVCDNCLPKSGPAAGEPATFEALGSQVFNSIPAGESVGVVGEPVGPSQRAMDAAARLMAAMPYSLTGARALTDAAAIATALEAHALEAVERERGMCAGVADARERDTIYACDKLTAAGIATAIRKRDDGRGR